jgi:serine/threonine protein kinase
MRPSRPTVGADVVRQGEHTRITRVSCPWGTVVRKEPLGPDAECRVQHEVAILERLRGVEGVAQLAEAPQYPGSIVLVDVGGRSLAGLAKPLAVDDLIGLAVRLAAAVARMHRRGVMHRDIKPANIVISRDVTPCLVDFALATSFAEIRPDFTHYSEVVGTLEYLAPELTGRTGWLVDQRADLYALGATLYELATGAPPFGSGDPLRLTHDHLARVPTPPAEINPALPGRLCDIIVHLLEKEPDHRYQTADGVVYDLEWVREVSPRPAASGPRVGEHDFPVRLGLLLRGAEHSLPLELQDQKRQLVDIGSGLCGVSDDLREISRGIHPAILSKGGLRPALKALARRSPVPVTVDLAIDRRFAESVEVATHYVVAEALTNAAKHAHASEITLSAGADDHNLNLAIRDNGVGGADSRNGSGLIGLKDRVEALGGHLEVVSPTGLGTSLHATIPLDPT